MLINHVRNLSKIFSIIVICSLFLTNLSAKEPLSPEDVLSLKYVSSAQISPDGQWIAYTVAVSRQATDKPGGRYSELYLMSTTDNSVMPYITGEVNISSLQWKPDGSAITFKMKRGEKAKSQVWGMNLSGGEAYQITDLETGVGAFQWHPNSTKIGYTANEAPTDKENNLKEKGYKFITFEENLKDVNLYITCVDCDDNPIQLTKDVTVYDFKFSPDGEKIVAGISEKNLIDHRYMFKYVYLIDINSKKKTQITKNPGKLGNYTFSPDGEKIAYGAALTRSDHSVSQVFVADVNGSNVKNLTPPNFAGHVNWVSWIDDNTVLYRSAEGVNATLSTINTKGGERSLLLNSKDSGLVFGVPSFTNDKKAAVMTASSARHPSELVSWTLGQPLQKLTDMNPSLAERDMGEQIVYTYKARDGQELEGLLIKPVRYKKSKKYPLIVMVHGGPEANQYNRWLTGYSTPGQVLAGKGYAVFYPNYRASTGYGVEFAAVGYGDPAGVEFDDIADGIDALISDGIADKDRVGLGGGSYGGYAAAWFSSYYTEKIKAAVMFVGISNLISKRGTTDIPYEDMYVHIGSSLEDSWQKNLERSPVYYAHQSKSAVLIVGGADDTRVHPSQSMEYFRRLKMNDHPAVRLVQYPGEGHGNRMQTSQRDLIYRLIDWYDWYVKDANNFDGPMPPLDISENYGLDLE